MSTSPSNSPSSNQSSSSNGISSGAVTIIITISIVSGVVLIIIARLITRCVQISRMQHFNTLMRATDGVMNSSSQTTSDTIETRPLNSTASGDWNIEVASIERFLDDFLKEKPMRFTPQHLIDFTHNYAEKLGTGGFGVVYKGQFPNGVLVAVKVLHRTSDKRAEQQFMAEVGTIGRTYHINLVRLYGFCFHATVKALVYEYMEHGSLDQYLFDKNSRLEWGKLHEIALGTAKGIRYLHEECQKKIIHYDIKPGNVLLGVDFSPKVADFGLAKLCDREDTHVTLTGGRGTPGYAAPELWMPYPVTQKCDVYSFGMLLFEIIGRRRNLDFRQTESQEWFPRWVWEKFDQGELESIISLCGIEEKYREKAKRMCEVAMWCVQHHPESRPSMSSIVRMLEGEQEIIKPVNPFLYMVPYDAVPALWSENTSDLTSRKSVKNDSETEVKDATVSLGTKKMISKKKRQKKLKAYDLSALSEFLPDLDTRRQPIRAPGLKPNCPKCMKKLIKRESPQLRAVLNDPSFQTDPLAAIHQYLDRTQPPPAVSREKRTKKKKNKDKRKSAKGPESESEPLDISTLHLQLRGNRIIDTSRLECGS